MSLGLLIFLIFTLLIPFLNFSFTSKEFKNPGKKVNVIAHRGASGLAPENTLISFKKALDIGVDYIELDIHSSKDDSTIVIHDNTVNRTTNGKGNIEDLTYDELKKMDAGSWFNSLFTGERIPTIAEVLKLVNGKTKILIELKWPKSGLYKNLVKNLVTDIRAHHAEKWVVIQSFERKYLEEIHHVAPDLEVQELVFGKVSIPPVLFRRSISFEKYRGLDFSTSVNIFYIYLNKNFIREQNNLGKTVFAFGLNSKNNMIKAINLGVDGIITNYPDVAKDLLKRH